MRVLQIHNMYRRPGGEDQVVAAEAALLESRGHDVVSYVRHNDEIGEGGRAALALTTVWSRKSYREVSSILERELPDVVHCHNFLPLISPSVYYAARRRGVPTVQTLHNYRLVCPGALLFRDGRVCEDCLGKPIPWPGCSHACYRQSRPASGAVVATLSIHRMLRTWTRAVSVYIALTEFARDKLVQGGLPAARIHVKPNFVYPDPGPGDRSGGYVLFAGRLTPEKGVGTLLASWRRLETDASLVLIGDGPMRDEVLAAARADPRIDYRGQLPRGEALRTMQAAAVLVFPSEWYEGFPMTLVEALAMGVPIVYTDMGSAPSILEATEAGLSFRAGDANRLMERLAWSLAHPGELGRMSVNARKVFEQRYRADTNYEQLMRLYRIALAETGTPGEGTQPGADAAVRAERPAIKK